MNDSGDRALNCRFCNNVASTTMLCKAEGVDIRLCRSHNYEWAQKVREDTGLASHCPNCEAVYKRRKESQAKDPRVTLADEPITGPLAAAIERAMLAEQVLKPVRDRVLRRLAADNDAYVASVLSSQAQAAADAYN